MDFPYLPIVQAALQQYIGLDKPPSPDSHIMNDLGLNSLEALEVLLALEDWLPDLVIEDDSLLNCTVRDAAEKIQKMVLNPNT